MATLSDLPPELVHHITTTIARPRDLVAWSLATGTEIGPCLRRVAMASPSMTLVGFMARGAPLDVVRLAVETTVPGHKGRPSLDMLVHATRGGRLDVVKYVWLEAADREWIPKRSDPRSALIKEEQRRHLKRALKAACRRAHVGVVTWLLTRLPSPHSANSRAVVESVMLAAVGAGHLGVVEAIHARRVATVGTCDCTTYVAEQALERDRGAIVAWLHARHGDTRSTCLARGHDVIGLTSLDRAISCGQVQVARWLLTIRPASYVRTVSFRAATEAAARGHLRAVAMAHDEGLHPCTVEALVFFIKSEPKRVIDALRWAVGEPTVDVDVPVPQGAVRPIPAWGHPAIAYAVLGASSSGPFEWLMARPDARRLFTPGAVRWALTRREHYSRALRVCAAGLVSFDDCDVVATVARHLGPHEVVEAIEAGAPYTPSAVAAALHCDSAGTLSVLCERYGTGDVAAAVRAVAGHALHPSLIAWLRDRVPAVCVADLCGALAAGLVGPSWALAAEAPCGCPQCSGSRRPV